MIATLPMYDFGSLQDANDRLWALVRDNLRAEGIAAPEGLDRSATDAWTAWESPDLVLSQTCGYPLRTRLHDKVSLIGTPDYRVIGCPPGYYCSAIMVREDDDRRNLEEFDGALLAYNDALSQSGWAAPVNYAEELGIRFRAGPLTGGHRASAIAVAEGRADLAALDAVTQRLLQREEPDIMEGLRILAMTPATPGLPLIAAKSAPEYMTYALVAGAIEALTPEDRDILGIHGLVQIEAEAYGEVPNPPSPAHFE